MFDHRRFDDRRLLDALTFAYLLLLLNLTCLPTTNLSTTRTRGGRKGGVLGCGHLDGHLDRSPAATLLHTILLATLLHTILLALPHSLALWCAWMHTSIHYLRPFGALGRTFLFVWSSSLALGALDAHFYSFNGSHGPVVTLIPGGHLVSYRSFGSFLRHHLRPLSLPTPIW